MAKKIFSCKTSVGTSQTGSQPNHRIFFILLGQGFSHIIKAFKLSLRALDLHLQHQSSPSHISLFWCITQKSGASV